MQVEKAMSGQRSNDSNSFEVDKGIAALGFLSEATGESMYSLLKMMYLADKLHLQRFGRFIAGDCYSAMRQGPVPSNAYGIFQHLSGKVDRPDFAEAARYFVYEPAAGHKVSLRETPNFDELSQGEIDCLQAIVETYRKIGKWAVRDLSHDDAWGHAWNRVARYFGKKARFMTVESIAKQFDDEALIEHLKDSFPGEASPPEGLDIKMFRDHKERAA